MNPRHEPLSERLDRNIPIHTQRVIKEKIRYGYRQQPASQLAQCRNQHRTSHEHKERGDA
jgi:hypothetical protein